MICLVRKIVLYGFIILYLTSLFEIAKAQVAVWEDSIMIPTYGVRTDINPKFWIMEDEPFGAVTIKNSITYPYPMQDDIINVKVNKKYKALILENEYLRITCLPELNGKLHSVFDKTTGKEMFWVNNVIKPGLIAMRGAGIIGGKAFNPGPQVHTTTIMSPINAVSGVNDDGSAFIEVGNIDQTFRLRWNARITLHPGKAYLDERIRIYNPTDEMHPFYFWNNAALPNTKGQRFIYPMSLATFHDGKEFFTWPIYTGEDTFWLRGAQGKDMSWLKNYDTWSPIFAYKCAYDFFGAYDTDDKHGLVHVADRHALSGKKAWTWGNWDYGKQSQKTLTDNDGEYIEIQSGPLTTQSDFGILRPHENIAWQEYWFPIHGFEKGFDFANKDIAVEFDNVKNEMKILSTGVFKKVVCKISSDNYSLRDTVNLSPSLVHIVKLGENFKQSFNVTIVTDKGEKLASFINPLPIPKVSPPDIRPHNPEINLTIEEKFQLGQVFDRATDRKRAREYYEKALMEDSGFVPALKSLALMDIKSGLYQDAETKLKKALIRDEYDGFLWFYLGTVYLQIENFNEAIHCASRTIQCIEKKSIGYDLAGRAYMRKNQYNKAVNAFEQALKLDPNDQRANNHYILSLYAQGEIDKALKLAERSLDLFPTDLTLKVIIALKDEYKRAKFIKEIQLTAGDLDFEIMETSLIFSELGLNREALDVINIINQTLCNNHEKNPLYEYYMAYFSFLIKEISLSQVFLCNATGVKKDFVFASRVEELPILKYAVKSNPYDAYAHFQLGNLLADLGRIDEAVEEWKNTIQIDPMFSMAFRNLGLYNWKIKNDLKKSSMLYQKAIAVNQQDQTLYRDLAQILISDQKYEKVILMLEEMPYKLQKRSDVNLLLAEAYLRNDNFKKAISVLESNTFSPWEGQTTPWVLYNKACIELGIRQFNEKKYNTALKNFSKSLNYPDNLFVGKSDQTEEAAGYYWKGNAFETLGKIQKAKAAWVKGANGQMGSEEQNKYMRLCKLKLDSSKEY